jgi:glutamate-5-semialdehyde dehydrogenase
MSEVRWKAEAARKASYTLAGLPATIRDTALQRIADSIWSQREALLEANRKDLAEAEVMLGRGEITIAVMKRLELTPSKLQSIVDMVQSVASLDDPIGKTVYSLELDEGLELYRVTSPIGVVAVIFESRPDALSQIACLCLKSGNSVILKGGRETRFTNQQLYSIIRDAGAGLPDGWIQLIEAREDVMKLLEMDDLIDLIVPRGSNSFVKYIQSNTSIPVLGHSEGVCHVYVDRDANIDMAVEVCFDSKAQYPSVCNAVDNILVHSDIADQFLPLLLERFAGKVEVRGCRRVIEKVKDGVKEATDEDWGREYLDYIVAVRLVDNLDEAVEYVNFYGSHHTDAIVTSSDEAALRFMESVDSASVFWNASTRFADGYRYGLGSEVGISTGKIHARGPSGLDSLTIYKYYLKGDGHVVSDYVGVEARKFKHESINKKWVNASSSSKSGF